MLSELQRSFEKLHKVLIQKGKFSSLYRVEKDGKSFALKLYSENAPLDLLKEAEILESLNHENWVHLEENHSKEQPPYFLSEWFEGKTLYDVNSQENFRLILSVFYQIISALDYLHSKSWIHGDLKGSNILCSEEKIKIIDLGFAKDFRKEGSVSLSGTPAYMAPELFIQKCTSPSSDFYALAILCYRWIVGDYLFQQENIQEVLRWHLFEIPKNIHSFRNYIPIEFGDLLLRMLAKNPEERPVSKEIFEFLNEKFKLPIPDFVHGVGASASIQAESYELLGEAIRFYESQASLNPEEKINLGELYYRQGHLEKALDLLKGEKGLDASLIIIKVLTRRGKFHEAEKLLEEFERNFGSSLSSKQKGVFFNSKGVLDFYLGKMQEAGKSFQEAERESQARQDYSQLAVSYNNLGNILLERDEQDQALEYFKQAITYTAKSGDRIHEGMFRMSLGYFYHRLHQIPLAYDCYVQSIEILEAVGQKNEKARSLLNFSNLLIEANDLSQAFKVLKEAQAIFQKKKLDYLFAYSFLIEGDIFFKQGSYLQALSLFESAEVHLKNLNRVSDVLWALYHQVECKLSLGKKKEALHVFEKIKKYPERESDILLQENLRDLERNFSMENNSYQKSYALFSFQKEIEDLQKDLLGELDLSVLVEKILDKMILLTHAERGFVILKENEEARIALARNMDQASLEDSPQQISFSIAKEVMKKGEAILTVDALEDSRFSVVSSVHHLKLRSIFCLPFKNKDQVLGAIYLDHRGQSGVFQISLSESLKPFTEMLGKILLNARRFFEVEKNLKETEKKLEAVEVELRLKYNYQNIVGQDPKMKEVFSILDRVTDVEVPVVILGESGVGKELLAKAIHYNGNRSKQPFVSMNCQAIPENLFESELFGYVRGAFTGAISDRMGLVEQAHRGTLFLDEIGDMPLTLQGKLLRVLQEGKIRRLGDREEKVVDIRVIAATHRDLKKMMSEGSFREDLRFRLSVVVIQVPSLIERNEDLPLLVDYFLGAFSKLHKCPKKKISSEALSLLSRYSWPRNVRELENTLTNACVFSKNEVIGENDFRYKKELFEDLALPQIKQTAEMALESYLKFPYREAIQFFEKKLIHHALIASQGNISQASQALQIARPQLSRLVKKFRIKV